MSENMPGNTKHELQEAIRSINSTLGKCEKAITKLKPGTSSHTLTKRRIEAFNIAVSLIERELRNEYTAENPVDELKLRLFYDGDIPLMERWLYAPHVAAWYKHPDHWLRELRERRGEFSFLSHYIVEYEEKAVGFCQYYDCFHSRLHEVWNDEWKVGDKQGEVFSIDYLIGETEYLRRGLGKRIVAELMGKLRAIGAIRCIVSLEPDNIASRRVLEANGFTMRNGDYVLNIAESTKTKQVKSGG
ncbi:MAG: acetyltransferase [Clostridiales bacterium]|nr:acetyltransferase [Clostridiales bacterium]